MTKQTKRLIEIWLKWSIKEQSKLFNQNFITRFLYKVAVKKSLKSKY